MAHVTTELKIDGMTCGHCQRAVEQALASVHGVEHVDVDLRGGKAIVSGPATTNALLAAVQDEGYAAQIIASREHHD